MNTATIAAATGYSAQQVRDLETLRVIPAARRTPNGYRRFSKVHIGALHAYRNLAYAVGPVEARRVMREMRSQPSGEAVSLVCTLHKRLHDQREQALSARAALEAIRAEASTEAEPVASDTMTITELSQALGVRASTLRFWEEAGLVAPERITTRAGSARRYHLSAIRQARITAVLRAGGYRIPEVQRAMTAITEWNDVSSSLEALDARIADLGQRALALLRAGSALAEIIIESPDVPARRVATRAA